MKQKRHIASAARMDVEMKSFVVKWTNYGALGQCHPQTVTHEAVKDCSPSSNWAWLTFLTQTVKCFSIVATTDLGLSSCKNLPLHPQQPALTEKNREGATTISSSSEFNLEATDQRAGDVLVSATMTNSNPIVFLQSVYNAYMHFKCLLNYI